MSNQNVELMRGEPEIAIKKLAAPIMISMILTTSYNIIGGFCTDLAVGRALAGD